MLLRALFLTVVVACVAANWPCPNANDIQPCTCTADAQRELTMDCSEVQTSVTLADIFQTHFSFNDFKQLIIHPTNSSKSLQELPSGVFGPVSFKEIDITNTRIHDVEEQALVNSHTTLTRLNLASNEIATFPFETLDLFTALVDLDLSNNKLSGVCPDIVSDTLFTLKLSDNTGLMLTDKTFLNAVSLEELFLSNMQLGTSMPADVFKTLKYLRTLHLDKNAFPGEMIEGLINPELNPLQTLSFDNNPITQIHRMAITGMKESGYVSFRHNNIEFLYEENWTQLVSQLSNANAIDIRNNPLVCGCDVKWLVFDPDLMYIFHNDTTCVAGNKLVSLEKPWFLDHCQ